MYSLIISFGLFNDSLVTVSKAERSLGYKTTIGLEEGVKKMIEWARKKGAQKFMYLDDLEIKNDKT